MGIELFVNFERQSNNSVFYRQTSATPYVAVVRLSGQEVDPIVVNEVFNAKYTLNYDINTLTDFNLITGINVSLNRSSPTTHTIQVYLSSKEVPTENTTYEMSAVFINNFPSTTFVAYPSGYFIEETGEFKLTSPETYRRAPGLYFYGEGHTENIILSASIPPANHQVNWFIGNDVTLSDYPVLSSSVNTAVVKISSFSAQDKKIPIHVRLTNSSIKLNGPVFYFDDITGEKKPYSFYASSLNPNGVEKETEDPFTKSIHIKPYPESNPYSFNPAFSSSLTKLPFDYTDQWFAPSFTEYPRDTPLFYYYELSATIWQIDANTQDIERSSNWSYQTNLLPKVNRYKFPLSYTPIASETVPFLKISSIDNTTITNTVTALINAQIQKFPYDWKLRTLTVVCSSTTTVESLPYVKVYNPSYFAIKNFECYFEPVQIFSNSSSQLQKVSIASDNSETVILTGDKIQKEFNVVFNRVGKQTLSATAEFLNLSNNIIDKVTNIIPNCAEVLVSYDGIINSEYYHTPNTSLITSQLSAPRLSPNEWITESNINNVLEKISLTLDEVINHSNVYIDTSNFYAWLGNSNYRWSDLECLPDNTDKLLWNDHVANSQNFNTKGFPLFWTLQNCDEEIQGDVTCLQKYCLEWNWLSRRRGGTSTTVTWSDTKKNGNFEKKWTYEPCETDSVALPCSLGKWHVSTIDPEYFPLKFCGYNEDCFNLACVEIGEYLVIAKKTEINLIKNTYNPKKLQRSGFADTLFSFSKIEGMCTESNRLYVLDSLIPRVSVYEIVKDRLVLVDSWGRFGFVSNGYGFNRPKDISIDQNNFLYIADTGNKCIKKYTLAGKYLFTFKNDQMNDNAPLSVAVDSQEQLHILLTNKVLVLDKKGNYIKDYSLNSNVVNPVKISSSYNREVLYISHEKGIEKYFRNGILFHSLINNLKCSNGSSVEHFKNVFHTVKRDLYVCANDKILKYADQMKLVSNKSPISSELFWPLNSIKLHNEEYVQSWVYLKAFHRLWDNIELVRNSLYYNTTTKPYAPPIYSKEDLVIGQNEIVTNSVINRLSEQLWTNLKSLVDYFK